MTVQVVEKLANSTDIDLIDIREDLPEGKKQYETYSRYSDPAHWSNKGDIKRKKHLSDEIRTLVENDRLLPDVVPADHECFSEDR